MYQDHFREIRFTSRRMQNLKFNGKYCFVQKMANFGPKNLNLVNFNTKQYSSYENNVNLLMFQEN